MTRISLSYSSHDKSIDTSSGVPLTRRVGIAEVDGDVERRMSLGVPDEREEEVVARGLHHRHLSVSQGGLGPKFGGGDEGLEDGSIVAESPFEFDVDVRSVISDGNPRLAGSKSRVGATVPLVGGGRRSENEEGA